MANNFLKLLPDGKKNAPTGEAHPSCQPRRARTSVVPWNTGLEAFDPQLTILDCLISEVSPNMLSTHDQK